MKFARFFIIFSLLIIFGFQASLVMAKNGDELNKPITGPITSPITSPLCKPGWGFGDKNHCHFGPPGHDDKNFNKFLSEIINKYIGGLHSIFHFEL